MLDHAENTLITGGTFTIHGAKAKRPKGLIILQEKIAAAAFHDSDARSDPPKCHPRTRKAILNKIMDWVKDPEKLELFIWLYGPAGSGKTAIAQSIAEMCHEAGLLAASFFFSRTVAGRNTETFLIPTLAYQLTLILPDIRERIYKALENDPLLLSRSLKSQMDALIVQPLKEVVLAANGEAMSHLRPRLIILDGLDECINSKAQHYILEVLSWASRDSKVPLFFLVASRPEQFIRNAFNDEPLTSSTLRIVLDNTYNPDADIKVFLESKLKDIIRKHPAAPQLPVPWPTPQDLEHVVQKSSGQFIYASTVIKFLDSHRHWPPERLNIVFGLSPPCGDSPFAELDALYHYIFSAVADIDQVLEIISVLLCANLINTNPATIGKFLSYTAAHIRITLGDLHSILDIPLPHEEYLGIRVFHASLADFLFDRSRSGQFFIDAGEAHAKITMCIMGHLSRSIPTGTVYRPPAARSCPNIFTGTIGITEKFLRSSFIFHCANSSPNEQLLDKLYDFDLFSQVKWRESVSEFKYDDEGHWDDLLIFLQANSLPHRANDLLLHHQSAIDSWLQYRLQQYPRPLSAYYFLRGRDQGVLVTQIESIIQRGMMEEDIDKEPFAYLDAAGLCLLSSRAKKYPLSKLGFDFLSSPVRAGKRFMENDTYETLAKIFLGFLLSPTRRSFRDEESRKLEKLALEMLPLILSRASRTPNLANFLRTQSLEYSYKYSNPEDPAIYLERNKAIKAIQTYLQEMEQELTQVPSQEPTYQQSPVQIEDQPHEVLHIQNSSDEELEHCDSLDSPTDDGSRTTKNLKRGKRRQRFIQYLSRLLHVD